MTLSDYEKALCIAALEYASKTLTDGSEASLRLGTKLEVDLDGMAREMSKLSVKLMSAE